MRSDKMLESVLLPIGLPVKYYEYSGASELYIVYNEEAEGPGDYGDNRPLDNVIWWQVHLFAPKGSEFRSYKNDIRKRLLKAGYIVTDIATLFEKETKTIHVVISCHMEESEE